MKKFIAATLVATSCALATPAASVRDIEVPMSTDTRAFFLRGIESLLMGDISGLIMALFSPAWAYIAPQSTDTLIGDEHFVYTSR